MYHFKEPDWHRSTGRNPSLFSQPNGAPGETHHSSVSPTEHREKPTTLQSAQRSTGRNPLLFSQPNGAPGETHNSSFSPTIALTWTSDALKHSKARPLASVSIPIVLLCCRKNWANNKWVVRWVTNRWTEVRFQPLYNPQRLTGLKTPTNKEQQQHYCETRLRLSLFPERYVRDWGTRRRRGERDDAPPLERFCIQLDSNVYRLNMPRGFLSVSLSFFLSFFLSFPLSLPLSQSLGNKVQ